ncbi:MAG: hypothetical protein HKN09_09825 [Saprospiraceae bacterium]|nr:hypothetical protein [Saprospiraceae bacterium]
MIQERFIDEAVIALDQKGEHIEQSLMDNQDDFIIYLNEEIFKVFTEEETQLLLFLVTVIHHAYFTQFGEIEPIDMDAFNANDDNNWKLRESFKNWNQAKDAFFEQTNQEDALAFVEDMLAEDGDDKIVVSDAVQEIIFITAKSFIDTLTAKA